MARKFDHYRIQEIIAALSLYSKGGRTPSRKTAGDAAEILEEMTVVVYGIQERFPLEEEVRLKGDRL